MKIFRKGTSGRFKARRSFSCVQSIKSAFVWKREYTTKFRKMTDPRPIILAGPSGVGKTTLVKLLQKDFPGAFGFSVSHTTRQPRAGEEHGKNYYFTDVETFLKDKQDNKFVETTNFSGNYYGTSFFAISEVSKGGKICLLDIDIEGVLSFKRLVADGSIKNAPYYLMVVPPSFEELERRLTGRGDTDSDAVQRRLTRGREELEYAKKTDFWDRVVVNDKLEAAHAEMKKFVEDNYPELNNNNNNNAQQK
eukprot:TRINITY_DN11966_c0_g1_i1.p1 TRINITY_DN11966_c0_g1~~TRINITY_DN11966_c0_g1_i1.p1  ORF type:complete len:250 (+),score=58.52 TRINITY_DN11966_c0_g1_i1:12-761(+)